MAFVALGNLAIYLVVVALGRWAMRFVVVFLQHWLPMAAHGPGYFEGFPMSALAASGE